MSHDRLAKRASVFVLLVAVMLVPAPAWAGGRNPHDGYPNGPSVSSTGRLPAAYPFHGSTGNPPGSPWCYAVPIQAVYQFPAVLVNQPGSEVGYLWTDPTSGLLGGRPYLYHP